MLFKRIKIELKEDQRTQKFLKVLEKIAKTRTEGKTTVKVNKKQQMEKRSKKQNGKTSRSKKDH